MFGEILHFRRIFGEAHEGHLLQLLVRNRNREPVAKLPKRLLVHLLGLMRDHLAFAGFAHPIALDGLGEDDRRLPLVLGGRLVSRIDLRGIVTAARQPPDFIVAHMSDHAFSSGYFPKKCSRT